MLNRRTLRIKAMQSIFAYEQCKEANYHLALERISDTFKPDLNSMEKQDKVLLKAQGKEASELFKENYKLDSVTGFKGSDDKITEEAGKAIATYHNQVKNDGDYLRKGMIKDAELVYERYVWLLHWLHAFIDLLEIGRAHV